MSYVATGCPPLGAIGQLLSDLFAHLRIASSIEQTLIRRCILNDYFSAVGGQDDRPAGLLEAGNKVAVGPLQILHGMNVFSEMKHVRAPP